jgi:serine/threonine-protein kinase RsbW
MEFLADLSTLEEMMHYLRSEAARIEVDEKTVHKMELACEEAIVNIISYAYPDQKGPLIITCSLKGHRFEIVLRDRGIPFNPIDVEVNPQIDKPVLERSIGGLGIYLIRKTIDEAYYQRVGNENILRLTFS